MPWIKYSFWFIEVSALILFVIGLRRSWKYSGFRALEFATIFIYGVLLEELDMRIFKSYHYGPDFFLVAWHVPLSIAWLWAVILASSMALSDRTGIPEPLRPFLDALLAVWLDLSIDAIAIRVGYWSWVIPLEEGWFGVPAGNLYAWMWVAFSFSLCVRVIRLFCKKNTKWAWGYLAVPFFSYALLFISMSSVGWMGTLLGFQTQNERLYVFAGQFLIFFIIVVCGWAKRRGDQIRLDPFWIWARMFIHIYFIIAFFFFGIYQNSPILGWIAFLVLVGELAFHRLGHVIGKRVTPPLVCLFICLILPKIGWAIGDSRNPEDWFDRAQVDLEIAETTFEDTSYYHQVCFLAHQAVEKKLKGLLWSYGQSPERIHGTEDLYKRLVRFKPDIAVNRADLRKLDSIYVPSRYPQPGYAFERADAQTCLDIARPIFETESVYAFSGTNA